MGRDVYDRDSVETPAPTTVIPPKGRLLGVDYGTVRIGLAISDPDRIIASPLETYARRSLADDAEYFAKLVPRERIVGLVVGLAMHSGGEEGIKAKECRDFAAWLTGITKIPAVLWDERFTTSLAEDMLQEAGLTKKKRKARLDRVAAQLILQAYIEAGCPGEA